MGKFGITSSVYIEEEGIEGVLVSSVVVRKMCKATKKN